MSGRNAGEPLARARAGRGTRAACRRGCFARGSAKSRPPSAIRTLAAICRCSCRTADNLVDRQRAGPTTDPAPFELTRDEVTAAVRRALGSHAEVDAWSIELLPWLNVMAA